HRGARAGPRAHGVRRLLLRQPDLVPPLGVPAGLDGWGRAARPPARRPRLGVAAPLPGGPAGRAPASGRPRLPAAPRRGEPLRAGPPGQQPRRLAARGVPDQRRLGRRGSRVLRVGRARLARGPRACRAPGALLRGREELAMTQTGAGITDLHSHLMAGVDDGAADASEARAALAALRAAGAVHVVTTPPVDGSLTRRADALERRLEALDAAWTALAALAAEHEPGLRLERGAEVMLDVPTPQLDDPRLRIAGGPFVLVEFPHRILPPQSANTLARLAQQGWIPLVAHPERYASLGDDLEPIGAWRRVGAYLQVNGPALLGRFGPRVRANALTLLARGWADCIASD